MFHLLLLFTLVLILVGCRAGGGASDPSGDLLKTVTGRGKLIVGVKYDSPPFGFMDAGRALQGYEIDIAHRLAEEILGNPKAVAFTQVNSSTRVATLNARQVDFVLATMTITPDREKVVDFSSPYYKAAQAVMVRHDSPIRTLDDLADKRIIYVIGTTGEANLKERYPKAKLLGFKASTEAFSAFYAGRADAFSTDDAILNGFMKEYCGLRLLDERLSEEPYGIAFRKDEASKPLQAKVEEALEAMAQDGTLERFRKKWHQPKTLTGQCGS